MYYWYKKKMKSLLESLLLGQIYKEKVNEKQIVVEELSDLLGENTLTVQSVLDGNNEDLYLNLKLAEALALDAQQVNILASYNYVPYKEESYRWNLYGTTRKGEFQNINTEKEYLIETFSTKEEALQYVLPKIFEDIRIELQ